ncbi:MAG: CHASE3 domain-containing protein [Betaproteobacteria bacterium]
MKSFREILDATRRTLAGWRWDLTLFVCSVVTVGILVVSESGHSRLEKEHASAMEGVRIYAQLGRLAGRLADAETAQRGYLLTHSEVYLEPYREALPQISTLLDQLDNHFSTSGSSLDAARMRLIKLEATKKVAEMETTLFAARQGQWDAAVKVVASDVGKYRMDAIRQLVEELQYSENEHVADRVAEWHSRSQIARLSIAAVTALNVLLLVLMVRWLKRHWREAREHGVQMDRQVKERTSQLAMLASHLQEINEQEKSRLARELHDDLGSILTASRMDISWVRGKLLPEQANLAEKLGRALKHIDQGVQTKRRITEGLRPTTLTSFGLVTAAHELVAQSADQCHWQLDLDLPENDPDLSEEAAIALFRILQESLNNAAKYSQTTRIRVSLSVVPGERCTLEIEDFGIGFQAANIRPKAHGILGMRERLAARGGTLTVDSVPDRGTRITASLPLSGMPPQHARGDAATERSSDRPNTAEPATSRAA